MAEYALLLPFYDVVHVHFSEFPSALRKSFFVWLAKLLRKKVVIHLHTYSALATIEGRHKKVYRYLYGAADEAIVLSDVWKESVAKAFDDERISRKVSVVYNPCVPPEKDAAECQDLCLLEKIKKFTKVRHIILFAGTVSTRKGYADLLRAFCKIKERAEGWALFFAGDGDVREGVAMTEELGIADLVMWTGWVEGACKQWLFSHAEIFCLPSYAEGFPMGVLDAWAYSLPVVTTPVGGIPDVAEDGVNILLAEPGDVDGLSGCLLRLISDVSLRESISRQSAMLAKGIFSLTACDKKIDKIYQNLFADD